MDEIEIPAVVLIVGSDASAEAERIRGGEEWRDAPVAGLQFYGYGREDLDGAPVRPLLGQRLNLVREPDNWFDENAIQVWLGNSTMIGHLPSNVAGHIAGDLDAGRLLRAYCSQPGDGSPWSLRLLLVGEALAPSPLPAEPEEVWTPPPGYDPAADDIPF